MRFNYLKRALFLLVWIIVPLLSFANEQSDALFAKANSYYAKAKYREALAIYQQLVAGGNTSAAVYFNMGNASYKLEDIPSALLYYEKAHKILPADEDINFNIKFANAKTVDKIEEVPEFFINVWFKSVFLSFSANTLAVFSVVLVLLGSGFLVLYFFAHAPVVKKSSFFTALILFFFGLLTVFMVSRQAAYFAEHKQAIIFANTVTVKSEPTEKARALFVIHDGTKVNVLQRNESWIKVSLANGNEGWMKVADLKEI